MLKNIRAVFGYHLPEFQFTEQLAAELQRYVHHLMTRTPEHVEFFASTLIGVHTIRYTPGDANFVWDIVLETDRDEVRSSLQNLRTVDKKWNVGGNVTNHAYVYLMHKAYTSKLNQKTKDQAVKSLLFILMFKYLTSLYQRDYKYPANKEVALATYNKLSNRFLIKQVDSWYEFFTIRANEIYEGKEGRKPFKQLIEKYDDDKAIVGIVTGLDTSLNRIMVRWNRLFHVMHKAGEKIGTSSRLGTDGEGNSVFNDLSNINKYRLHLESRVTHSKDFLNPELIEAVCDVARKPPKRLETVLKYLSKHYEDNGKAPATIFVNSSLNYGISKLVDANKDLRDIRAAFHYLNSVFISPKAVNVTLERIRKSGDQVLDKALKGEDPSGMKALASVYIVLWTLITA